MVFKKGDFIEIEFIGKIKNGGVFDSNTKEGLEKIGAKGNPKPFIFCIGYGMFIKGVDNFLIGKEGGEHKISLKPEDAFGKRDSKLIQMIPIKNFIQHKLNPIPGSVFNFDGRLAKVLTVSGGRVMIDFNNPLAGKDLEYEIKILREIKEQKEKIDALNDFFFRKKLEFEIKEKKLILKVNSEIKHFVELFTDKYKEMIGLDIEVEEIKKKEKN